MAFGSASRCSRHSPASPSLSTVAGVSRRYAGHGERLPERVGRDPGHVMCRMPGGALCGHDGRNPGLHGRAGSLHAVLQALGEADEHAGLASALLQSGRPVVQPAGIRRAVQHVLYRVVTKSVMLGGHNRPGTRWN